MPERPHEQFEQFPIRPICRVELGQWQGKGQIKERFEREVTRTLQGSEVTKNGDDDNPAYLVRQDNGDEVLKRGSELKEQS